jgi:SAM-dependent methyltransferase
MAEHRHEHGHGHVHLDEADWEAMAETAALEGALFLDFVTEAAAWVLEVRGPAAPEVGRVVDIGSGPGVGTCELARRFPEAQVVAFDGSPAMLQRAEARARAEGLDKRVTIHLAELPGGLAGVDAADVVWASNSLHHVGDEVAALREMRGALAPGGVLALAELAAPLRVLPDDLGVGRPGLADRIAAAGAEWFGSMRAGLPGSVASIDLPEMVTAAGFDVVGTRLAHCDYEAPLTEPARQLAVEHIRRARHQFEGYLDPDDLRTLDVLGDPDDPRSVDHRPDVVLRATRHLLVARPENDG